MRDAIALIALLEEPNVQSWLRLIRAGESSQDEEAYRWLFGSTRKSPKLFDSFDDHPRVRTYEAYDGQFIANGKIDYTTAAGAYQITETTWNRVSKRIGLKDFTPRSQDIAALALTEERGALDDVLAGRIVRAMFLCRKEWASLPASDYGQPTQSTANALAVYRQYGGLLEGAMRAAPPTPHPVAENATAPPEPGTAWPFAAPLSQASAQQPQSKASAEKLSQEHTMPVAPILAAVLPSIISAIPALGKLFGSGSEVAERNVKAAEIAVGIVKEAVGARNEQEAAETVAADPAMAQVAREAVAARWMELTEAGGGGIEGARKAEAAIMSTDGPWWNFLRSPSFWCLLILAPLVYMIVLSLIGIIGTATWSDDVRAGLAGSIVSSIIGAAVGYYWGQSTSRNRAPG